ncbi:MAG: hypothetical protein A2017_21480 [Lentisphaerae bacterium GWF2_44_16]|nr:MAG: hypothetical protein A2017_21480 [Lentisphaerae bacterium GWF2_44_16]
MTRNSSRNEGFKKILLLTGIISSSLIFHACNAPEKKSQETKSTAKSSAQFDPGGVSIDLSKSTQEKAVPSGENIMINGAFEEIDEKSGNPKGWYSDFHIHTTDKEQEKRLEESIKPITGRKILKDNPPEGKNYILISTPPEAHKIRGDKNPLMSNYYSTTVKLPQLQESTKYLLSFKYKGKLSSDVPGLNSITMAVTCYDGAEKANQRKETRKMLLQHFPVTETWKEGEINFLVPKETGYITLYARLYGCGEAAFDDIQLHKVNIENGVTVRMIPFSFLDNLFCLSSSNPGILTLSCRNEKGEKINKPFIYLELPEKVELVQPRTPLELKEKKEITENGKKYIQYKIDVNKLKNTFQKDNYGTYQGLAFLLHTELPPGIVSSGKYWYEDGDYKTPPRSFDLKVLPSVKGKTPKIFESGVMFNRDADFDTEKGAEMLTSFYKGAGFNVVHIGGSPANVLKGFSDKGIKRYVQPYWLCNGYRLGQAPKTDSAKFKMPDGSYYKEGAFDAICPVEVYTEGKYFKEHIVKPLRKILVEDRSTDSIMPNWEPYMFDFKGCFCDNCKKDFIKHSGLPENEVNKLWPKDIVKAEREKWTKFRSWQHAQMLKTLEENINSIGKEAGLDSHFIPEIAWSQLIENSNCDFAQYNPLDYLEKLPVLEPWGPYVFHSFTKPYIYNTGVHLIVWTAAKEIKDFVARHVNNPAKRPKLIAFPHGYQGSDWVTEPEAISFEFLSFFLNGWEGAIAYIFPRGYDARYWTALAQANTLIADYEDFVFKGKKINDFSFKIETPAPPVNLPKFWSEGGNFSEKLPSLKNNPSIVQGIEYELNGKRMIAVGNFWQKADVFVKLSVSNLPKNKKYVLTQPQINCCFSNAKGETALSPQELQDGMLVHIGALRFSFFVVEEYKNGPVYGTKVTPSDMERFKNERLPEIKKIMAFENEYRTKLAQKAAEENKIPDYALKLKSIKSGKLSCRAEKIDNSEVLRAIIENGDEEFIIDPAGGGRVKSWKCKGTEIVLQDAHLGLAVDAFWWPAEAAAMQTAPYEIDNVEIKGGQLTLSMSHKLKVSGGKYFDGALLMKTYKVSENAKGITISTEIKNTTEKDIRFSFRYHNMLSFLELKDGKSGYGIMKNGNETQRFDRIFTIRLYRLSKDADKDLEKAFRMDNIIQISNGAVEFGAPWTALKLSVDILNKKDLHCFIFWDSGKQAAATFEPLYKIITLKPGMSWNAGMELKTSLP